MKESPIIYIFGYGSLMYAEGINGRGMTHDYTNDELIPAKLYNYRRGVYALYQGMGFYSCTPDKGSYIYGVLVPIYSIDDYNTLLYSEGATDAFKDTSYGVIYEIKYITNLIKIMSNKIHIPKELQITTLVHPNHKTVVDNPIYTWYKNKVNKGIKWLPKEFQDKFYETGGIK